MNSNVYLQKCQCTDCNAINNYYAIQEPIQVSYNSFEQIRRGRSRVRRNDSFRVRRREVSHLRIRYKDIDYELERAIAIETDIIFENAINNNDFNLTINYEDVCNKE
jgi:hypothetical protein